MTVGAARARVASLWNRDRRERPDADFGCGYVGRRAANPGDFGDFVPAAQKIGSNSFVSEESCARAAQERRSLALAHCIFLLK
jgi:hypothetical protein